MSRELDDIYHALRDGMGAAEALMTWQTRIDGSDSVRSRIDSIRRGLSAYERLSRDLRDGHKHIEPPEDFKRTNCYCSEPTCSPPCSWCTDPDRESDDTEAATPTAQSGTAGTPDTEGTKQ